MDRISTIKTTLFISLFPMPLVSMGSAVGGNGLFEIAFLSRIGYLIERYIKKTSLAPNQPMMKFSLVSAAKTKGVDYV